MSSPDAFCHQKPPGEESQGNTRDEHKKKKYTDELELDLRSNESKQEVDFLRRRARCVKREEADMMREARHPRLMLIIQDIIFPFSCFL